MGGKKFRRRKYYALIRIEKGDREMTSKECLERIIFEAKMEKPIFSMYYQEFLKPIEKDLELLDIIKFLIKKGNIVVNSDLFVDYPELYEWLEQNE